MNIDDLSKSRDSWRDLALKFDRQRMAAMWHLQALLKDFEGHKEAATKFLAEPPAKVETGVPMRLKAQLLAAAASTGSSEVLNLMLKVLDAEPCSVCGFQKHGCACNKP